MVARQSWLVLGDQQVLGMGHWISNVMYHYKTLRVYIIHGIETGILIAAEKNRNLGRNYLPIGSRLAHVLVKNCVWTQLLHTTQYTIRTISFLSLYHITQSSWKYVRIEDHKLILLVKLSFQRQKYFVKMYKVIPQFAGQSAGKEKCTVYREVNQVKFPSI